MPSSLLARIAALLFCCLPALLQAAPNSGKPRSPDKKWGLDFSNPMQFTRAHDGVGNDVIFAAGNINAETLDHFLNFLDANKIGPGAVVVLHSNGNDALAGMQLGRLIRQHSLQTSVGRRNPAHQSDNQQGSAELVDPGECDSACSLAFLGGVYREVPQDSLYVIHAIGVKAPEARGGTTGNPTAREYETGFFMGQVVAGDVEQYLLEMGIASDFLLRYRQYDSNARRSYAVPQEALRNWRVVNAEVTTHWSLAVKDGRFAFIGINPDSAFMPQQHEQVIFRCEGRRRVSMEVAYLPPPAPLQAGPPSEAGQYELAVSSSHARSVIQTGKEEATALSLIAPSEILEPFRASPPDPRIRGRIDITPRLLALLESSPRVVKFGFRTASGRFYGFPIDFHAVRKAFFNFVSACS